VGNTYQLAKLSKAKGGQHLALEELRQIYKSDVIGLKLGHEHVVVVFGNDLLNDTFRKDEFLGRPDNFFMKLRTMGLRRGENGTIIDL
jgi:cytochrome P450 family 2 subfamily L